MFETLEMAKADPILGLNEAFNADSRSSKVNLGVGVYKNDSGNTPILLSVKTAENTLIKNEKTKGYLGIVGKPSYNNQVKDLIFGINHPVLQQNRAATVQAPGGTGALKIAADFLKKHHSAQSIWISNPSWANHKQIFSQNGFTVKSYRYYDAKNKALDFEGFINDLDSIPSGEIVLLHACCHNPTGVDPSPSQWEKIAGIIAEKKLLVLFDMAYQGFANSVDQDPEAIRVFANKLDTLLIASSFSKNFGLYNERIGALTFIGATEKIAQCALSQIKVLIRTNYSNPPAHGALIVDTILNQTELKQQWLTELASMNKRIKAMRVNLAQALSNALPDEDFSFITQQNGMFSFSGLTLNQVHHLKHNKGIYIVDSGRINIAGLTTNNLNYVADSIIEAIKIAP